MSKEVDLDFKFSNDELANFLENFAEKIREGEVGLSFKGKEEVQINPTTKSHLDMEFKEKKEYKSLELEVELRENIEKTGEGRQKIQVEIV